MTSALAFPSLIQGGMGIGVSHWRLAHAVAREGHLGVVSGTALDSLFIRRLQDGDPGGHMRRTMAGFPLPKVAAAVLHRYFRPGGRRSGAPYALLPMYRASVGRARQQLTMLASFVEVRLAKEGHSGPVGINLLAKVQLPNLAALYGAMLAGVDYVLMGAGIPREIPGVLDAFAEHRAATLKLEVQGPPAAAARCMTLDPRDHWDGPPPALRRPRFVAIVASNSLATMLARKATGRVDGFVVEGPSAGGHNAPPRGTPQFNERGEPLYGYRDEVDLAQLRELGIPFWIAGGAGSPEAFAAARAAGAAGIQVGTLFAYCDESGLADGYKQSVLAHAARGELDVYTDPLASPTGYPFKVVRWPDDGGTAAEQRERVCDLGYLRSVFVDAAGRLDYRCPAEPVEAYVRKGGAVEETEGRRCLCNALMANVGYPQIRRDGRLEPPLLTSGDDLKEIAGFLQGRQRYTAREVIAYLLGSPRAEADRPGEHSPTGDAAAPPGAAVQMARE